MGDRQITRFAVHKREQLASKVLDQKCTLELATASFTKAPGRLTIVVYISGGQQVFVRARPADWPLVSFWQRKDRLHGKFHRIQRVIEGDVGNNSAVGNNCALLEPSKNFAD